MRVDEIVTKAVSQIGVKESPAGSNKQKYGVSYGWNGVAWCMIFVWWVYNQCGFGNYFYDGKKTASCTTLYNWAKANGKLYKTGKKGDVAIFQFSGGNRHTGIVEKVDSKYVYTIDGNTSNTSEDNGGCVMRKKRALSTVLGYVRLIPTSTYTGTFPTTTVKSGTKGTQVGLVQKFLNWYGNYGLTIDNSFGPKTLAAVKDFQKKEGLEVDGSFGPKTLAKAKTIEK